MSEAGFQFELERSILFLLFMESENYLGEVRWAYMESDCAAYSIQKKHFNSSSCSKANWHYFSDREEWFLSFFHSAFDGFKLAASLWQQNLVCASFKCKCNRGALRKIRRWFETHSRQMLEWIFEATCVIFTQHQPSLTSKCVTAQNTSPF